MLLITGYTLSFDVPLLLLMSLEIRLCQSSENETVPYQTIKRISVICQKGTQGLISGGKSTFILYVNKKYQYDNLIILKMLGLSESKDLYLVVKVPTVQQNDSSQCQVMIIIIDE